MVNASGWRAAEEEVARRRRAEEQAAAAKAAKIEELSPQFEARTRARTYAIQLEAVHQSLPGHHPHGAP